MNYDTIITAYSDAPAVELYSPDGSVHNGIKTADGVFTFDLLADEAVRGRYELRTVGNEKDNRSVFFAAVSLSDALRHGMTMGDKGEENRVMGFLQPSFQHKRRHASGVCHR